MSHTAIDILILIFGCASFMGILIFALTYREIKIKAAKNEDDGGWLIMNAYRDSAKAQLERKAEVEADPNEPEFGQGWFSYIVRRDFEEMKRQREQRHDKTS
tara:strand:- start:1906 stop:2211 length:306 start_codon:yes stop_codon:yes gene_type:complete